MIAVWGGQTSRSIRVVWVLDGMGLPIAFARFVHGLISERGENGGGGLVAPFALVASLREPGEVRRAARRSDRSEPSPC